MPKSLLGQFIDSVGENVSALLAGPPEPQPVAILRIATQVAIEEPAVEITPEPQVATVPSVIIPPIVVFAPQSSPAPIVHKVVKVPASSHSGGGGGGGETTEEVLEEEEEIEELPVEDEITPEPEVIVEPEPVLEPEPEPVIIPEIDITPPAIITDLAIAEVGENAVQLQWTATGDDAESGTATSYDVRYATSLITEENWLTATLVAGLAVPEAAGDSETFELFGLAPMTTYYFALKTKDEAGNESMISNVASTKTLIAKPTHVVISEIFPDMVGADINEFVELYNPTDAPINISGYSLQYLPGAATALTSLTKKNFTPGATIPAKGFYLVGMWGNPAADMVWSDQLNNAGGSVFLVSDQLAIVSATDEHIIDRVAYGVGSQFESAAALLPGEGKSIERKALINGACVAATAAGEFSGNGCDTNNNGSDFEVRMSSKGQRTTNLFEPRSAPSVVSGITSAGLQFAWSASTDASGSSVGMLYKLTDTSSPSDPVQLYGGTGLSYAQATQEIGRTYKTTFQAIDRDGLTSEAVEVSTDLPSYLKGLAFYQDPASPSGSPAYQVKLQWENYPFIPANFTSGPTWHLVVFYYNEDAKKISFLGQLNTGHNWGMGVSMPSVFRTGYKNCFSNGFTQGASLILPDDSIHCSGQLGNIKASAIDFGLLRDKVLTLPVLAQTFSGTNPTPGESYITVAFYAYNSANPLGSDMGLVAVDKTRYYLAE